MYVNGVYHKNFVVFLALSSSSLAFSLNDISEITGRISMKFDVNNLWVMVSQNTVFFYWLMSIRGGVNVRLHPLFHRLTMGKISKIVSSETTGPISRKFNVNNL